MSDIKSIPTPILEAELVRRKEASDTKPIPKHPFEVGWKLLYQICANDIDEHERGESEDSDTPHYIYKAAMEAIYGKDVWEWINKHS